MESAEAELQTVNLNETFLSEESPNCDNVESLVSPPSRPQSVASVSSSIAVDFENQLIFDTNFVEENPEISYQQNLTGNETYEKEEERPSSAYSHHSTYSEHHTSGIDTNTSYMQTNGYQETHHQNYNEHVMHNATFQNGSVGEQSYEYVPSPVPVTPAPTTPVPHYSRPSSSCSHSSIAADFVSQPVSASPVNQHYNHQQPQNFAPYGPQPPNSHYNYYEQQPVTSNYQQQYNNQSYPAPYYASNPYYSSGYYSRASGNAPPYQPPHYSNSSFSNPNVSRNFDTSFQNRYYDHNVPQHRPFDMNSSYGAANTSMGGFPPGADPSIYQDWIAKYTQWWYDYYAHSRHRRGERQRLTPLAYPTRHSRVTFGSKNMLITVSGQSILLQQLDSSLIDVGSDVTITTWPGPLIKTDTDKNDVLEYIRTQESTKRSVTPGYEEETYYYNHQRKQLWQLLLMLVRQNGIVSGADLAELLITNNEVEFETGDEGSDISKLRKFLMFGQRKTAVDFASKSGQWGHAFALSYLTSQREMLPSMTPSQIISLVFKFINSNMSNEDPLYVLYRCLLQKLQDYYSNSDSKTVPITNLPQFAILLANDCDVTSQTISGNNLSSELLKSIVAIRNNESQYFIKNTGFGDTINNQYSFSEEILFINEIFEFGKNWNELVYDLIPYKLVMAAKLFDFGLLNHSQKYCQFIRNTFYAFKQVFGDSNMSPNINWSLVMKVVNELESRLSGYDVGNDGEDVQADVCDESNSHEVDSKGDVRNNEMSVENGSNLVAKVKEIASAATIVQPVPTAPPTPQNVPKASHADIESSNFQSEQKVTAAPVPPVSTAPIPPVSTAPVPPISTAPVAPIKRVPLWRQRQSSQSDRNSFDQKDKETPPATPKETHASLPPPSTANQTQMNFFIPVQPSPSEPVPDFVSSSTFDANNTGNDEEQDDYYSSATKHQPSFNSTRNEFNQTQKVFTPPFSPITSPTTENSELKTSKIGDYGGENKNSNIRENEKPAIDSRPKGFLDNLFSKFVPAGPKRAILPDDKNPAIVWDEKQQRWVDKNEDPHDEINKTVMNGPPKIPLKSQPQMFSATNVAQKAPQPQIPTFTPSQLQFTKSKQRRYVDILQQQKIS